jgi:hypothetical protein
LEGVTVGIRELNGRLQDIIGEVGDIARQTQVTELALQRARVWQRNDYAIRLISEYQTRLRRMREARVEEEIGQLNFKTSMHYLSITLAQTRTQLNEFHDWASNYDSRRQEWLHKYPRVLAKYYEFHREDDDDKDDEKNAADESRPLEEASSASENDEEARPFLGNADSDDDAVHDLTIGGGPNVPPTRPQFNERPQDVSPQPDNHSIRCCNIL